MPHEFSRTELLIGKEALEKLRKSKVAIFGIGGVGTFTVEGLVRSGVGKFVLIDDDCICLTNINRQIHATHKTVGKPKVEVMRQELRKRGIESLKAAYSKEEPLTLNLKYRTSEDL